MRHNEHYWSLVMHTHLLRAALRLAVDRDERLRVILENLDADGLPEREFLRQVDMETAYQLGGVRTRATIDVSEEISKHHFGPLQVALALLHAMIVRYRELAHADAAYRDAPLDKFCQHECKFVGDLERVRHSLLHDRYGKHRTQEAFVRDYYGERNMRHLLGEACVLLEGYVKRLRSALGRGGLRAGP